MKNNLAPIVLFVYNRLSHTKQVVESLLRNELALDSHLFIYSDGFRTDGDISVKQVREYIKTISGFKCVTIFEREKNYGLADNIVLGVTEIVNKYGKIIVLEDDIVTSPAFLEYMNNALRMYEYDERVMHVSGYMFPVKGKMPNTFFYNTASCWGWGTWKRAWQNYNGNALYLLNQLYINNLINEFDLNGSYKFTNQLTANISGRMKTWAVKWYASFFLLGGFSLHPFPSFTNNIGNDGSGENCGIDYRFMWDKLSINPNINKIVKFCDKNARKKMEKFYRNESFRFDKEFIKKFIPPVLLNLRRFIKNKINLSEYDRIKRIPRYIYEETQILGRTCYFTDSFTFLCVYNELFKAEIYKFKTENIAPYIIDAGAHIGLSILYFKKLYPASEILAFEPDNEIFDILSKNTEHLNNLTLIKKALWDSETELSFINDGVDKGRIEAKDDDNLIKVSTDLLSNYINKPVDLLKIDIEGAELKVLEECKDKLYFVDKIFIKYHSFENKKQNLSILIKILEENNFRYSISSSGLISSQPFINVDSYMKMELNIYAYKK